jgi:hypothetical protein
LRVPDKTEGGEIAKAEFKQDGQDRQDKDNAEGRRQKAE